jgi:hypothetical protein
VNDAATGLDGLGDGDDAVGSDAVGSDVGAAIVGDTLAGGLSVGAHPSSAVTPSRSPAARAPPRRRSSDPRDGKGLTMASSLGVRAAAASAAARPKR